jgi:hypothetical protein
MPEEETVLEGTPSAPEGEASNHDAHLSKVIRSRDGYKAGEAKAVAELDALKQSNADAKTSAKEKAAKDAGDMQGVLEAKNEKLATKDQRIAELEKQVGGFQATGREAELMRRIYAETKGDQDDVLGAYLVLSRHNGWDAAPEDVDTAFKERTKALKTAKPNLFKEIKETKPSGEVGVTPPGGGPDLGAIGADATAAAAAAGITLPQVTIPGR